MYFSRSIQLTCIAVAAIAAVCGCSKKSADVLARIGDREITVADFKAEYERRQAEHLPLPDRQTLLDQMVDREAVLQQAHAAGVQNAADVRRAYEDLLIQKFRQTRLEPEVAAVKVTPEEIRDNYTHNQAHYTQPAKVKLAMVFVEVGAQANSNQIAAAESRADEALAKATQLSGDKRGFGAVAADYSDDQITRYRGGDAGWFAENGVETRWPKEIVAAGFALKNIGDISSVLRGKDGFYLVKKIDARASTVMPLEQVQPIINHRLLAERQQDVLAKFRAQCRDAAHVSVESNRLSSISYPTQTLTKFTPDWPAAQ